MPLVAHDRIIRTGLAGVFAAITLSVLLAPLGEPWRTATAAVLTVVLIALGSPHGALDHLVLAAGRTDDGPARNGSAQNGSAQNGSVRGGTVRDGTVRDGTVRDGTVLSSLRGLRPGFVVGYVGLALASLAAYLLLPRLGFALFLVLSVAHFAAGEAGVAIERGLARGWTDPLAWAASLGGAVVVVLPLASREAGAALAAVDPRLAPVLTPLPTLAVVVTVAAAAALVGCVVAALRGRTAAGTVGTELAALLALSVLAHPLLAFAAFFAFWHSLRHQARLAQVLRAGEDPAPRHAGRPLREVLDSARAGVPATVGVLLGAGALALTGATLLGGLLAVIWALTVPHSAAVAVLEVRGARARRTAEARAEVGAALRSDGVGEPLAGPVSTGPSAS